MKTNDTEVEGFAEMAAAAPRTEFDDLSTTVGALSNNVGALSVELDDLKRRVEGPGEAVVAKTLLEHGQRIHAMEQYLQRKQTEDSVQRESLERQTRHSALDLAIKACPTGTEFDTLHKVYEGMLGILRGNV